MAPEDRQTYIFVNHIFLSNIFCCYLFLIAYVVNPFYPSIHLSIHPCYYFVLAIRIVNQQVSILIFILNDCDTVAEKESP